MTKAQKATPTARTVEIVENRNLQKKKKKKLKRRLRVMMIGEWKGTLWLSPSVRMIVAIITRHFQNGCGLSLLSIVPNRSHPKRMKCKNENAFKTKKKMKSKLECKSKSLGKNWILNCDVVKSLGMENAVEKSVAHFRPECESVCRRKSEEWVENNDCAKINLGGLKVN